ncbi:MAG: Holliday junction branch migration protein RuvA [candidate division WOR-3 bacterium]
MIGYIKGRVVDADGVNLIVEAGGVGYSVMVTPDMVRPKGEVVELFVHTHFSQDSISLFGFASPDEREVFRSLLSVQGLGPSGAMKILSGFPPSELRTIIESGDSGALRAIKGIGPKLADRIIFFLRGKLPERIEPGVDEVVGALVSLGMKESEARSAAQSARKELGPGASVEDMVRHALRRGE